MIALKPFCEWDSLEKSNFNFFYYA
jgi:hypothetical protein